MPNQDPLAQLRDIHLPDAINAWPPAPGWWLLALLFSVLIVVTIVQNYKRYHKNRYRRQALKALTQLNHNPDKIDYPVYLQQLNLLLKQTALAANPSKNIAGLSGKQWLLFLDDSANIQEFSNGIGHVLLDGPYNPTPQSTNIDELQQLSKRWIKRHKIAC